METGYVCTSYPLEVSFERLTAVGTIHSYFEENCNYKIIAREQTTFKENGDLMVYVWGRKVLDHE